MSAGGAQARWHGAANNQPFGEQTCPAYLSCCYVDTGTLMRAGGVQAVGRSACVVPEREDQHRRHHQRHAHRHSVSELPGAPRRVQGLRLQPAFSCAAGHVTHVASTGRHCTQLYGSVDSGPSRLSACHCQVMLPPSHASHHSWRIRWTADPVRWSF